MILAGDIGGTKTQLGFFKVENGTIRSVRKAVFPSQEYGGLEEIVARFLAEKPERVEAACFGVAGPIIDGKCVTTNLPWIVSSNSLAELLSIETPALLNDLEAFGYGVPLLEERHLFVLNLGQEMKGNAGIIAAGTGLGEASLFWDGARHVPSASEGGHVDFAPRNETEIELLRFMLKRHDRVSVERLLSGPGLFLIYDFLRSTGHGNESKTVTGKLVEADPSSVVSTAALIEDDPLSKLALDMFVSIYGATAGNLALTLMATGGIYVGGGIAPKILTKLKDGSFMKAFVDKGRFSALLSTIPVRVILNDEAPLLGAARVAAQLHR